MYPTVTEFIKKYTIENFEEIQDSVLLAIDTAKDMYDCHYDRMAYSDYKVKYRAPYRKILEPIFAKYFKQYSNQFFISNGKDGKAKYTYSLGNMWFAEYEDGATFGWHCHEGCNMSAVIQLVLDEESNGTQFMDSMQIPLKEGDIVFFPSMVPHRSPIVSKGRKIIIGINFDMF